MDSVGHGMVSTLLCLDSICLKPNFQRVCCVAQEVQSATSYGPFNLLQLSSIDFHFDFNEPASLCRTFKASHGKILSFY